MDLSKSEKKAARILIERGLKKEFEIGLDASGVIIDQWKQGLSDPSTTYQKLFKHIRDFDKNIAHWYDGMRGSQYFFIVAYQLRSGLISKADLGDLSPAFRLKLDQFFATFYEDE